MAEASGQRRRLIITSCRVVKTGSGERGPWELHQLEATTLDGKPIRARLISFDAFEPGEAEVVVERQDHPEHGISYRLRRPRPTVSALAARVDELERRLYAVAGHLARLEAGGEAPR